MFSMQSLTQSLKYRLRQLPARPLIIAASLAPLLVISKPVSATDLKIYFSSGHSSHGYHHKYRTRPGFALSYGTGSRYYGGYHGRHYHHYESPRAYYHGKPYGYKKVYPSKRVYGYPGYGRPFSYYHDNARSYNYKHGYRHGYGDGYHDGRHKYHHKRRHKLGW